jgi:hypothetical protein
MGPSGNPQGPRRKLYLQAVFTEKIIHCHSWGGYSQKKKKRKKIISVGEDGGNWNLQMEL